MSSGAHTALTSDVLASLKSIAKNIRKKIIQQVTWAGCGHPGGSLSATDLLTTLYFRKLRHDSSRPNWEDRDRFVLSKGHCTPLLYALLSEAGYFPESLLSTFRKINSKLQGHPEKDYLPGVEMSTGALGQGLSIAHGMALGLKLSQSPGRVFVLMGDGEIQEGMIWEAAMSAGHYKTENLVAIVDLNGQQIDGFTQDIMNVLPVGEKFKAFGWDVQEIDGHDLSAIDAALDRAISVTGKPAIIVAKTIKGKGVSYMEGVIKYHGVAPTPELAEQALQEIEDAE